MLEPMTSPRLLLVAHGTRSATGRRVVGRLLLETRKRLRAGADGVECRLAWVDVQAPGPARVLEDGAFQFQDGSVTEAQTLMLCTGYNFTYPFLDPTELGLEIQEQLVTPLYKFMMPPAFPSLFILGVCKIICPFPHFHCQVSGGRCEPWKGFGRSEASLTSNSTSLSSLSYPHL